MTEGENLIAMALGVSPNDIRATKVSVRGDSYYGPPFKDITIRLDITEGFHLGYTVEGPEEQVRAFIHIAERMWQASHEIHEDREPCPDCGTPLKLIQYGYYDGPERDDVYQAGCMVSADTNRYYCEKCQKSWP